MSFEVAAEAYDRFMGRYSALLSPQLADARGRAVGRTCSTSALRPRCTRRGARRARRRRTGSRPPTPPSRFVTAPPRRDASRGVTVEQARRRRAPAERRRCVRGPSRSSAATASRFTQVDDPKFVIHELASVGTPRRLVAGWSSRVSSTGSRRSTAPMCSKRSRVTDFRHRERRSRDGDASSRRLGRHRPRLRRRRRTAQAAG